MSYPPKRFRVGVCVELGSLEVGGQYIILLKLSGLPTQPLKGDGKIDRYQFYFEILLLIKNDDIFSRELIFICIKPAILIIIQEASLITTYSQE